jgi:hypothetical protein
MLSVTNAYCLIKALYAECRIKTLYAERHIKALYAECHYAECLFAKCRYAEWHGTWYFAKIQKNVDLFPGILNLCF